MPEHDKREAQREHFNSIAKQYEAGRKDKNHIWIKNAIWHRCLTSVSSFLPKQFSMFEAMCGYAEGYDLISKHFEVPERYLGVDYSDDIVEAVNSNRNDIVVIHGDITNYVFDGKQYDLIVLIGGLHHVPDHAAGVVKAMAEGLKPGGVFINFEPTHNNFIYKKIREWVYERNAIFDEGTEHDFSTQELESFFVDAGLKNIYWHNAGLAAYTLFYNPYAFPWLNLGGEGFVRFMYSLDELVSDSFLGRKLSFATMSAWHKPVSC